MYEKIDTEVLVRLRYNADALADLQGCVKGSNPEAVLKEALEKVFECHYTDYDTDHIDSIYGEAEVLEIKSLDKPT